MSDDESVPSVFGQRSDAGGDTDTEDYEASSDAGPPPPAAGPGALMGGWGAVKKTAAVRAAPQQDQGVSTGLRAAGSLEEQRRLAMLEHRARQEPYNTGVHLQLVQALKPLSEDSEAFAALRRAREAMRARCALSPQQWAEWVQQEQAQAGTALPGMRYVCGLLRDAAAEFHFVPLHVELCLYTNQTLEAEGDSEAHEARRLEQVRDLYEQAVRSVGKDFLQCDMLWRSYMEFIDDEIDDDAARNLERAKLFKRLCCIPHANVAGTADELGEWLATETGLNEETQKVIASAQRSLSLVQPQVEARLPFEARLKEHAASKRKSDLLRTWKEYIGFEEKTDQARALVVCYRAITAMPWCGDLWLRAVDLQTKLGDREGGVATAKRALRSIPRSARQWIEVFRSMERCRGASFADAAALAQDAEQVGFHDAYDLRQVALELLSYGKRCLLVGGLDSRVYAEQCKRYTSLLLKGDDIDGAAQAARIRASAFGGTDVAVQHAFEELVHARGTCPALWHAYTAELRRCSLAAPSARDRVRAVYRQGCEALAEVETGLGSLAAAWLDFERCHGTAAEIDTVRDKHADAMKSCDRPAPDVAAPAQEDAFPVDAKTAKRKRAEEEERNRQWKERKVELGMKGPTGPAELTAFLWNLPFQAEEADVRAFLKGVEVAEVRIMRKTQGASLGRAYVDVKDADALEKALAFDNKKLHMKDDKPRKVRVQRSDPVRVSKPQEEVEARKLLQRRQQKGRVGREAPTNPSPAASTAPKSQDFFKSLLK